MNNPDSVLNISGKLIGEQYHTYFIADIAANHDGDLSRAIDLIYLAAEAGADAAKFQHFNANTIVSNKGFESLGNQLSHQSKWKKSVFEVYEDASVPLLWTETLKKTCDIAGISFFTSPYDLDLVDHVNPYVPAFKIGSGDITWHEIIQHIAHKNKPYMIATGASSMDDVVKAVNVGLQINSKIALMQCNTNYTANLENFKYIQLNVLKSYRAMYPNMVLGLSDHTLGHTTVLGAVALGARIIEKHFTDDPKRSGPDHLFSMAPLDWKLMVESTRELENALGCGIKKVEENERETVILQRRSLRVKKDLPQGTILTREDLTILRPCSQEAISPDEISQVLGRQLVRNLNSGEHLKWNDFL
jgi:N-acetylneuraminate synthase